MAKTGLQDILDKYPGHTLLKEGGQKDVYRVTHEDFGEIALKIGIYDSARTRERIKREVMVLKSTESEYFPKIHDFQELTNNRFVIYEEFIDSRPLSKCLDEFRDPKKALCLLEELVTGLQILWNNRIVHRDLKPDNILIKPNEKPVIIDLGVARILDMESLTSQIGAPYTAAYAAPEQIRYNRDENEIRTDQFALGIILFQLLVGVHPFDPSLVGGSDVVRNILDDQWPRSTFESPPLDQIRYLIFRLLGTNPYERFRKPEHLLSEINHCLGSLT